MVVFEFLFRFVLAWLISPGSKIELTLPLRGGLRRAPSLAELKGLRGPKRWSWPALPVRELQVHFFSGSISQFLLLLLLTGSSLSYKAAHFKAGNF